MKENEEEEKLPKKQNNISLEKEMYKRRKAKMTFSDDLGSVEYEGEVNNLKIMDGFGIAKFSNGSFYEGEFKFGFIHGKGYFFNSKNNTI